ncbi:MAG: DNA recombination protein RmuC [Pseudomonadota bacterium]
MVSLGSGDGALTLDWLHLALMLGVFAGLGAFYWAHQRLRAATAVLKAQLDASKDLHASDLERWRADKTALETMRQRVEGAERDLSVAEARALEREKAFEAERASLKALNEDVAAKFQGLADSALNRSQSQFLQMAGETFAKQKEGVSGDLRALLEPMQQTFGQFRAKIDAIEKVRAEDRAAMVEQIKGVGETLQHTQSLTGKLVNALSAPKGGGRWGEETLRNVLEMAGLSDHADFVEQSEARTDDGKIRPDVVIRMPGGRELVIDSKVSIDDYLKASEDADGDKRAAHLAAHARNVRAHVKRLAEKSYWRNLSDAVDFVAMFIPGENFYAAALEQDRDLFDFAARNRVIIVTPSTLVALAKAVAYGWRQEQAAENARQAAELGRQLHDRLVAMTGHMGRTGSNLEKAVGAYNDMVASMERRVLPAARKFEDLQIAAPDKALEDPARLDISARPPALEADAPGASKALSKSPPKPPAAATMEGDEEPPLLAAAAGKATRRRAS